MIIIFHQAWGYIDDYLTNIALNGKFRNNYREVFEINILPTQIILIISGRDRVPLTSLVHPMVSADCNSSVYEVLNRLPRRFRGAWDYSLIPTRYLVAQFALEIIMCLRTQQHVKNEVIWYWQDYLYNASNHINLEASGPRPRLISNNVHTQWCTSPLEKDCRFLQK